MKSNNGVIKLKRRIDSIKSEMTSSLIRMCKIPAISPLSGGDGEAEKGEFLLKKLSNFGFDKITSYNVSDRKTSSGYRPNIIVELKGLQKRNLWFIVHMDVVTPGDLSEWETKPFYPHIEGDFIYGRGVEDNGQSLIATLYATKALIDESIVPNYNICIALVSDEEEGSEMGIKYLLRKSLFKKSDLIVVPDFGTPNGGFIEIAEKSRLVSKFIVRGTQCHASRPQTGINSFKVSSELACELHNTLYSEFKQKNLFFSPPISTFALTKKECIISNYNVIPGTEIFYLDSRILPGNRLDMIINKIRGIASIIEKRNEKEINKKLLKPVIDIEFIKKVQAPPLTPSSSSVVNILKKSIKINRNFDPKFFGTGSNTCALFFRQKGFNVAVWSTIDNTAHRPNEYIRINNLINDCKVFATMQISEE